jgi:hypothetical protein
MRDIRIVLRDRLRSGHALERRDLLPEMVQHRIRRCVPIVGPTMRLTTCDDIDPGNFLLQDGCLHRPELCISHVRRL